MKNSRRAFLWAKHFTQKLRPRPNKKRLLFIFGCQRSGTTLLSRIFEKDWSAKSYSERSSITSDDKKFGIRLNALPKVQDEIDRLSTPFVVMKPLVESQRAPELLDYFQDSRAIWIYRHYKDVAASNIKKFGLGNGIEDLRQLITLEPGNWRSELVPPESLSFIEKYFSEDMNPFDAAVLFWYARNALYFHLELDQNPNILICKYEKLVECPQMVVPAIYEFAGRKYPGPSLIRDIHANSIHKGSNIEVSPEIAERADALVGRLDMAWTSSGRQQN